MATNIQKGFTLEYCKKDTKRVSCKDCKNYCGEDYSCFKQPVNLKEVGFDIWKHCKFFTFDKTTSNSVAKIRQLVS